MIGKHASAATPAVLDSNQRTGFDLRALDGLRGLAALYVVILHARVFLWVGPHAVLSGGASVPMTAFALVAIPFRYGTEAVLVFFLISGFVIHLRQAEAISRGERPRFAAGGFFFRRARRLMPALLFALALTAGLDAIGASLLASRYAAFSHSPAVLAGNAFFVQRLVTATFGSNGALWSLSYEGVFYVIYPVWLAARLRFGMRSAFGGAFAAGIAGLALNLVVRDAALLIAPYFAIWAMGALVAELFAGRTTVQAMPLLALGTVLAAGALIVGGEQGSMGMYAVFGAGAALLMVVLVLHPWGRRAGAGLVKFRALGACSYTLYVTHLPILILMAAAYGNAFGGLPRGGWLAIGGVMAAVAFAFAAAPLVELPFVSRRVDGERTQLAARLRRWAPVTEIVTDGTREVDDERLAA